MPRTVVIIRDGFAPHPESVLSQHGYPCGIWPDEATARRVVDQITMDEMETLWLAEHAMWNAEKTAEGRGRMGSRVEKIQNNIEKRIFGKVGH